MCECDLVLFPKLTDDGFYFYLLDAILTSISISFFLFQSPVNRFRPGALPTRSHPETRSFSRTPHRSSEPCRAPATELQSSGRPRGARRPPLPARAARGRSAPRLGSVPAARGAKGECGGPAARAWVFPKPPLSGLGLPRPRAEPAAAPGGRPSMLQSARPSVHQPISPSVHLSCVCPFAGSSTRPCVD